MFTKIRTQIKEGGTLEFTDNQTAFLQKHIGSQVFVQIDERTTVEKQRFIEGAIIKFYFYQMPNVFNNFADARYSLKVLADHTEYRINPKGKREMVVKSMAEIYQSNPKTVVFIDKVHDYFLKNGFLFPDNENFKSWDDTLTSKDKDQIYPPLQELKNEYLKQVKEDIPVWRK